ncbi:MAG: glucose dehydrogenase [Xanthomonadales bacterium]|nr:glucose dehydrogenase [Xanthomonadales bacterium]MDL1869955.1 PQQ-dependent sugar dehydrogenase [Gammaproteobacteria bacterium PRO6]
MRKRTHSWLLLSALLTGTAGAADAPGPPVAVHLTPVATGLTAPIGVAAPADGSGRLFILDSAPGQGRIRVVDAAGKLLVAPYYVRAVSGGPRSEQGLLGLAFDPGFARNGTLYLTYTAAPGGAQLGAAPDQVLVRLRASHPAANVFAGSEQEVLRLPDYAWNHNGGGIAFGPDNYLYWGMGDGGRGGDPHGFAQDLWHKTVDGKRYHLLGKMLRLDVRTPTAAAAANQCGAGAGQPAQYSIPHDNPFAGAGDKCGEIWLYGLRNPWRWSFDRQTHDLVIGDVGQNAWEEIDFRAHGSTAGRDYGWRRCEGRHHYDPAGAGTDCPATTGTVAPVIELAHGPACSITGGYVYRGPVAALRGKYLYSDYCDGRIRIATPGASAWSHVMLDGTPTRNVSSFGEDTDGNVYVADMGTRTVYRFDGATAPAQAVPADQGAARSPDPP